jgi:hypothetical protein
MRDNFMRKIFRLNLFCIIGLSFLSLLLGGCAATAPKKIAIPLEQTQAVGVVAFMGDVATRLGSTAAFEGNGTVALNGFHFDHAIATYIANDLKDRDYKRPMVISVSENNPIATGAKPAFFFGGSKTFADLGLDYIKQNIVPGKYQTIVMVTPSYLSRQSSEVDRWNHFRYGVSINTILTKSLGSAFFIAYDVTVLDGSNYQVLAKDFGDYQAAGGKEWPKEITDSTPGIVELKEWLKYKATPDISRKVMGVLKE